MNNIKEWISVLPEVERIVVTYANVNKEIVYIVTENIRTGEGTLYKNMNKKLKKVKTNDIPFFQEAENFLEKERKKYE